MKAEATLGTKTVTVTYDEILNPAAVPPASAFKFTNNAGDDPITAVAVSGSSIVLTKTRVTTTADTTMTVDYVAPGAAPTQDLSGNAAASFSAQTAVFADIAQRMVQQGSALVEAANGDGYNYRSTGSGFGSLNSFGVSIGKLASGLDGYFRLEAYATGSIGFRTTQSVGQFNTNRVGAHWTVEGQGYSSHGSSGATTIAATNWNVGDTVRMRREGTTVYFEVRRRLTTTWIQVFSWTGIAASDLWGHIYCASTVDNCLAYPAGSPNWS